MSFKNYNGPDKYHFRVYKKGKEHPFIVAVVEEIAAGKLALCTKYDQAIVDHFFSFPASFRSSSSVKF